MEGPLCALGFTSSRMRGGERCTANCKATASLRQSVRRYGQVEHELPCRAPSLVRSLAEAEASRARALLGHSELGCRTGRGRLLSASAQ